MTQLLECLPFMIETIPDLVSSSVNIGTQGHTRIVSTHLQSVERHPDMVLEGALHTNHPPTKAVSALHGRDARGATLWAVCALSVISTAIVPKQLVHKFVTVRDPFSQWEILSRVTGYLSGKYSFLMLTVAALR